MKLLEADVSKIIKDLGDSFGGSNEEQMKGVQLLKGLATSDEPLANEFMKAVDKATSEISNKLLKKEESADTAKCPDCGEDYLVNTGYCPTCKKKVKESKEEVIEVTEDVRVGDIILEKGDKIKIVESMQNLAQRVKSLLDAKGYTYKAITYNERIGEVTIVLGFDYPEERWEQMQDMLETSGFRQEINNSTIMFVPATSEARGEMILVGEG